MARWFLCILPRRITELWHTAQRVGNVHHDVAYRFFSAASWSWNSIGLTRAGFIISVFRLPVRIRIIIDDTLCHKRGEHIAFGSLPIDAVRSSRQR